IARSRTPTIELLPRVMSLSEVEKNCQKPVNTRENGSTRCSAPQYQQPQVHPQSIVLSGSFLCSSFSRLDVSQKCSQLIHMRFVAALASRLETRNQLRKRQEKNEFYFQLQQKNFLTEKMKQVCRCENRNSVSKNFARAEPRRFGIAVTNRRQ